MRRAVVRHYRRWLVAQAVKTYRCKECECEFESRSRPEPKRCLPCSRHREWRPLKGADSRRRMTVPFHPVAGARGGAVEHRVVLYDAIGGGAHACHWCKRSVTWRHENESVAWRDELVADHVDANPKNNRPENIVPACNSCNITRSRRGLLNESNSVVVSGHRYSAVTRVCNSCRGSFMARVAEVNRGGGKYCSQACRWGRFAAQAAQAVV